MLFYIVELLQHSEFVRDYFVARWCPNKNLVASGAAGKPRLSRLHCSERREPSGRFLQDITSAIITPTIIMCGNCETVQHRRSRCGNGEAHFSLCRAVTVQRLFRQKHIYYLVLQLACKKYCKNSLLIFLACDIINTYYKLEDILLCNIHMKLNLCNA